MSTHTAVAKLLRGHGFSLLCCAAAVKADRGSAPGRERIRRARTGHCHFSHPPPPPLVEKHSRAEEHTSPQWTTRRLSFKANVVGEQFAGRTKFDEVAHLARSKLDRRKSISSHQISSDLWQQQQQYTYVRNNCVLVLHRKGCVSTQSSTKWTLPKIQLDTNDSHSLTHSMALSQQ